jgi:hypothetical protein
MPPNATLISSILQLHLTDNIDTVYMQMSEVVEI